MRTPVGTRRIGKSWNVSARPNPHGSMKATCSPVGARGSSCTGTASTAGSPANASMTNTEASTEVSERRDSIASKDRWFSGFWKDVFGASMCVELDAVRTSFFEDR